MATRTPQNEVIFSLSKEKTVINPKIPSSELSKEFYVDRGIARAILNVWNKGVKTYASCEGHFNYWFSSYLFCQQNESLKKYMVKKGFDLYSEDSEGMCIGSYPFHKIKKDGTRDIYGRPSDLLWMYVYYFVQKIRFIRALEKWPG
jgi:hypothetical protein